MEQPLRVTFVSHSAALLGAERMLLDLVRELILTYKVQCQVVLPSPGPLVPKLLELGAHCVGAPYGWWCDAKVLPEAERWNTLRRSWQNVVSRVHPAVKLFNPDVVWSQTMVIPWGARLAEELGKPHVWYVTELGEIDHGFRFFFGIEDTAQAIRHSSDAVLTCSQYIADVLFRDENSVCTLYCPCEVPSSIDVSAGLALFRNPSALRLGIFSQVTEGKGTADIVQAARLLRDRGLPFELLVARAGDHPFALNLKNYVEQVGLQDHVTFVGSLPNPFPAMAATDICIVCSRAEAFGRVGVEAMRLARPLIYARAGGVLEYVVEGVTGLGYEPGDVEGLARCVETLARDPHRRRAMGEAGRAHAEKLFETGAFGRTAHETLQKLRQSGRRSRGVDLLDSLQEPVMAPDQWRGRRNDPCPCGSGKRFKHCHGVRP